RSYSRWHAPVRVFGRFRGRSLTCRGLRVGRLLPLIIVRADDRHLLFFAPLSREDVTQGLLLNQHNFHLLGQLQEDQKGQNQFAFTAGGVKDFADVDLVTFGEQRFDLPELFAHRHFVAVNFDLGRDPGALQCFAKDAQQVEHRRRNFGVILICFQRRAREAGGFNLSPRMQHIRRRLEFLILEQLPDQFRARVFGQILFAFALRLGRQQHLRLDVDQRRGEDEEIPGHGDVEFLHQLEVFQILLRDLGDGDVVDVNFVFPDQVKQQVERPLKRLQLHAVVVAWRFSVRLERFKHGRAGRRFLFVFGHPRLPPRARYQSIFTALRTSLITRSASAFARREPSIRMSRTSSWWVRYQARRSVIGARYSISASASARLRSTQPIRALRQSSSN